MTSQRLANALWSLMLSGGIVAVAVIARLLPTVPLVHLSSITPIAYALAIVGDSATAIILLSTWRYASGRRSTLVLGCSFAVNTVFVVGSVLALPLLPLEPAIVKTPAQIGILLYAFWHVSAAAGALAYMIVRRSGDLRVPSRRFVAVSVSATAASVAVASIAVFAFDWWLPRLVEGNSFTALVASGVGPAAIAALAFATWCAFRIANPQAIDRALAISLLALTLELTLSLSGMYRFTASYYAGRVLVIFSSIAVLAAAMRTLITAHTRLHGAEVTIVKLAGEASQRAGRISALWAIAAERSRPQDESFQTILQTATAAIRPGKSMFGCLAHLDDTNMVVDATSWSASDTGGHLDVVFPGATFVLSQTMASLLLAETGTHAWNDLSAFDSRRMLWGDLGWKSFIGTRVEIGRRTYFLTFACSETMSDEPFAPDDCAYIDLVAAFFASRFSEDLHFERLKFQIEHDALTGLHSRAQFRREIRAECTTGNAFTIAFVNIDSFRLINEHRGHMLGDEVLVEVAVALGSVHPGDLVARMNGDEFGVLIRGRADGLALDSVLDTYAATFRAPFQTGDREGTQRIKLSASIGAAQFPADGTSAEELMRRADVALSVAKERGGSTTMLFDVSMERILESSRVRLVELADAIAGDQLALVYQPTFDLGTQAITGAEALVRWDHPERGRLPPADFLAFAERNGLITNLTRWVFRRLIRDFSGGASLPPGFRVYFNISAQTLDDFGFIAEVNEALRAHPSLAAHLGVELTETAAMQNVEGSMHTINLLRKWGVAVAIDDFGTGFSSLSYLKQFTVDVVKIDRSFVAGLPLDECDGAITEMLLRITDRFGFATLAEGIETEAQAEWLVAHGCRFGQGYLFARPDSFAALNARLQHNARPIGAHVIRSRT